MLPLFWLGFWAGLTLLVFAAGLSLRARIKERIGTAPPVVDDDVVEQILKTGVITTDEDEPLDLREIDDEEQKFWSESWDEPEEW